MNFLQAIDITKFFAGPLLHEFMIPIITFVGGIFVRGFFDTSFKKKIANFEHQLRAREAEAEAAREQIANIHRHLMDRSSQRGAEFEKKKIEAVEQCWEVVAQLAPFRFLGSLTGAVDLRRLVEGASEKTSDGQKMKDFAKTLLSGAPNAEKQAEQGSLLWLNKVQLYLPSRVYEAISVYKSIALHAYMLLKFASIGADPDLLKSSEETDERLKIIIPELSEYIDKYKEGGYAFLYDYVEKKILNALRDEMGAAHLADMASVRQIGEFMESYDRSKVAVSDVPASLANNIPPPKVANRS